MQRDEYGKFVTKSGEHRAVRSLRLSDTTWSAMGEMAESRSLTKADLLEQMFKSKLDVQPGNTREEIEVQPGNTREDLEILPSNTREEFEVQPGNTRANIKQREDVVAQLRAENARLLNLVQKLSEVKDLEMVRDSVLSSLKLGKQAPKYKMVKSALDQFIKLLRNSV